MWNKQTKSSNFNKAWTQTEKNQYPKFNNSQNHRLWRHCHYTIPYNCNAQYKVSQKHRSTSISRAFKQQHRHRINHRNMTKNTQKDEAWVNQSALQQNSYRTLLHNRPGDHCGGGLALIHKNHIPTKELETGNTPTIEYAVWKTTVHNRTIHLMGIYHLPPSPTNKTMTSMFIDEMTDLLTEKIPKYSNLIISGDYNISAENVSNPDMVIFNDTMGALGLQQHVQGSTLKKGQHIRFNLYIT